MYKGIIDKIIELKNIYGEELFFDKQRFIAFIKDFFPLETRAINLLIRGMEAGLYQKLKDLSADEYMLFEKTYSHILHHDYLMDKNAALECIRLWHRIVMNRQSPEKEKTCEIEKELMAEAARSMMPEEDESIIEENQSIIKENVPKFASDKRKISVKGLSRENHKKGITKIKSKEEYTHKDIEEICERAHFYYRANPLIRDYKKAFKWYKRAAMLGHVDSMFQVGYMYENGRGVEKDISKALEWYMKAAQYNHKSAMNNIGYLYENGEGIEKDINMAITWYQKAMMLGDDTAKNNIRRLYHDSYRKPYEKI